MKTFLISCLLSVALVTNLNAQDIFNQVVSKDENGYSVGTLSSSLSVSPGGALNFTIPIELPEGRMGMTPQLALTYNSQGEYGLLGKGWSIAGWSYIARTGRSLYYDDDQSSVDFGDDGFVLDGSRMIKTSDEIGRAFYRTETDAFAKIVHVGAQKGSKDNSHFIVYTKDGLTKTYGGTPDSKQVYNEAGNPAIRYHLNRVVDSKGNYIEYKYIRDISNGEVRLLEINYTGNENQAMDDAGKPYYSVSFSYNSDQLELGNMLTSLFNKGNELYAYRVTSLLKNIRIKYDGTSIKNYVINYTNQGVLNYPYLTSIELEAGNEKMNPLEFSWNHSSHVFLNNNYCRQDDFPEQFGFFEKNKYIVEDIDFDGFDDIIEVGDFGKRGNDIARGTFLRLGKSLNNFIKLDDYAGELGQPKEVYLIDFNGDGEKELFIDGRVYNLNLGSTITLTQQLEKPITGMFLIKHTGDFNGDGIQDIIVRQNDVHYVYFGQIDISQGYDSKFEIENYNIIGSTTTCLPGDYIGSGTTNFAMLESNFSLHIYELIKSGLKYAFSNISTNTDLFPQAYFLSGITPGDFNGDGKSDLLVSYREFTNIVKTKILYSFGKGFNSQDITDQNSLYTEFSQCDYNEVIDLNNDGISDIIFCKSKLIHTTEDGWDYELQLKNYVKMPGTSGGFNLTENSDYSCFLPTTGIFHGFELFDDGFAFGDFNGKGNIDCFRSFCFKQVELLPFSAGRCSEVFSTNDGIIPIDAITAIIDGFGKTETISYKKFVPGLAITTFPVTNFNQSFFVVDKIFADHGKPVAVQQYSYRNMLAHAQGKGMLGFEYSGVTDLINHTYSEVRNEIFNSSATSNQDRQIVLLYPSKATTTYLAETPLSNRRMSESTSQIDILRTNYNSNSPQSKENLIHIPVETLSITQSWDIDDDNTYIGCNVQVQRKEDFDAYGNIKHSVSYADELKTTNFPGHESDYSWVEISETEYNDPDTENWYISRPTKITTTSKHQSVNGDCKQPETFTSISEFEYYKQNEAHYPLLHYKWESPSGNENLKTRAEFDYDVFGNVIKKTVITPVEPDIDNVKVTDYIYNPDATHRGRFLTCEKVYSGSDGDDMVTSYEYTASTGLLKSKTDINGLVTSYGYDAFGKNNLTTMPDGTSVTTLIGWSINQEDAPESALYYIAKVRLVPDWTMVWDKEVVFFDKLQRTLRSVSWNLTSKAVYSDKEYDESGRVSSVSEPYFKNTEPSLFTKYQYDRAGRNYSITTPTGAEILTENKGRVTKVTNMITENWTEKEVSIKGKPVRINDKTNGNIEFCYDAAGRETSIKKYGIITTFTYDDFGNRTIIDDPDAGITVTEYNKQNQIEYSTDARNNRLEFKHDHLGRLKYRKNLTDNDMVEYQYYDKSGEIGFGKLNFITKKDLSSGTEIHKTEFIYDELERIYLRKEYIDNEIYTFVYNYNERSGELEYYQYPSGYKIQYIYNNEGYMHMIKDVRTNIVLWNALENNPRGQLTEVSLGNGLYTQNQFDKYGFPERITTIDFNKKQLIKPYSGNLSSWPEAIPETIQDNFYIFNIHNGNLTKKWELFAENKWFCEAYEYDGVLNERLSKWFKYPGGLEYNIEYSNSGNINNKTGITVPGGSYIYGTNAGPHAVTGITGATQEYVGLIGNNTQTVLYNGTNMPYYINQMAQSGGFKMDRIKITYGNGDQRVKTEFSTVYEHYIETDTRYYFGDFEVEKKYNSTKNIYYHYLAGTNGVFAIMKSDGIEDNTIYYIHTDYLGSFQVISDQFGDKIEQLSYDPWGRRRNPADGTFANLPATFLFMRGYTGHEHYDKFGLINMNARLYDPFLGRFLSPDPQVQAPDNGQNYNRYTYALNNPLKYTDPDGEFWHLIIGAAIGGISNLIANAHKVDNFWQAFGYFSVGAVAGALSAGVTLGVSAAIAGAGVSGVAGASFATGFLGTSTAISTGFISGFVSGSTGGLTSGFISGFGNGALSTGNLSSAFSRGFEYAWKGAFAGGVIGGTLGGIDARKHDLKFWTGSKKQNVLYALKENGSVVYASESDIGNITNGNHLDLPDHYKTFVSKENPFVDLSVSDQVSFKIPQNIDFTAAKPNVSFDFMTARIEKDIFTITLMPGEHLPEYFIFFGERYGSINYFGDLFHSRLIKWPW